MFLQPQWNRLKKLVSVVIIHEFIIAVIATAGFILHCALQFVYEEPCITLVSFLQ